MHFSLEAKTASLSVGEFADFAPGPRESFGGPQGLLRAQLGQHWHQELRARVEQEAVAAGDAAGPAPAFEVPIEARLVHRGWTLTLTGRIDQLLPHPAGGAPGPAAAGILREIKTVTQPLPAPETALRADYPAYFLQLATYVVLRRVLGRHDARAELVFVEAASGLVQPIALTPFDVALVHHQLEAVVAFLDHRHRATLRRRALRFAPPFAALRPGQETIEAELTTAFTGAPAGQSKLEDQRSKIVLLEAPTGYGKTGVALAAALGLLRAGRFQRLIWLTGKSTGQLQVMHTLRTMLAGADAAAPAAALPVWQVRNKAEHCVNPIFHCVREACGYLAGAAERWPGSGLARFYLDDAQPRDLDTLREAGRRAQLCPYEITRAALAYHDVWVGDYNYVFAPDNQGLFLQQPGFAPAETLLVIDEAHNLPARVADAHSHRATFDAVHRLLADLDHLRAPSALVRAVEEWAQLLGTLAPCDALDPLQEAAVRAALGRLAELAATTALDFAALGPESSGTYWAVAAQHAWLDDPQLERLLWSPRGGTLEFTCVDAARALGETLRGYGGALLMSATLAPFEPFAAACGVAEPTVLRAPAPWRQGAYDAAVDLRVDTSFRHRADSYGTTAETVAALYRAAGGAVAAFFPSYAYAEAVLRASEHLGAPLRIALQPRLPDLAAQAAWVEEVLALADALFLVLGGSFAESIDLLGGRVSHAMVVGPALPEVNAVQRARMEVHRGLGREGAFRRVYQIPGLHKVNQALGRLVRVPGHRAKVLLHCRRFAEPAYAALLDPECQFYRELGSTAELHEWLGAATA